MLTCRSKAYPLLQHPRHVLFYLCSRAMTTISLDRASKFNVMDGSHTHGWMDVMHLTRG